MWRLRERLLIDYVHLLFSASKAFSNLRFVPMSDRRNVYCIVQSIINNAMPNESFKSYVVADSIVERPREIPHYPLLNLIYDRHDDLIATHVEGRTLELAFGLRPHPMTDVGIDAFPENARQVRSLEAAMADARCLPFDAQSFETVIGRRLLHHVPEDDRKDLVEEAARVLTPGGQLVILEGTPGFYRRLTKGFAFRLGVLGQDTDEYGHLDRDDVVGLLSNGSFQVVTERALGSPLMPLSIAKADAVTRVFPLYERTQIVRWWTLAVADLV